MTAEKHILFIAQEICPFLPEETSIRLLNRKLPEYFQSHGIPNRSFMPKFGEINERRNQLHEVIRLSGANLIIRDTDHPLLLKVASIPAARVQFYFIDNDDFFAHRKGVVDETGKEYADNDERTVFFCRGVLDTITKMRWTPDLIYCSGWMSALVPMYIRTAFADSPFLKDAKIVYGIDDNEFKKAFAASFSQKVLIDGVSESDIQSIVDVKVGYEQLMQLACQYADAYALTCKDVNKRLLKYIEAQGKPVLPAEQCTPEDFYQFFTNMI